MSGEMQMKYTIVISRYNHMMETFSRCSTNLGSEDHGGGNEVIKPTNHEAKGTHKIGPHLWDMESGLDIS